MECFNVVKFEEFVVDGWYDVVVDEDFGEVLLSFEF